MFNGSSRPTGLSATIYLSEPVEDEQANSAAASAFVQTMQRRVASDVRFVFPCTGQRLWSNQALLRSASTYFHSLLESEFAEMTMGTTSDVDELEFQHYTFNDSDAERDIEEDHPRRAEQPRSFLAAGLDVPYAKVRVTDTTYTTYASVLCWIGTRFVRFAPLKSSKLHPSEVVQPGNASTTTSKTRTLDLPTPASPKSVYRLAHLLELEALRALALAIFKSQLTSQNFAHELYADVASCYPEVRDAAIEFTVGHWADVAESDAFKAV
ncbi:hypothetical protein JCM10212_004973 [Sporobolomyces blumeae]